MQAVNQAAQLILNAQSVIGDLMTQAAEIQRAIERQQAVIDQVMPVAVWVEPVVDSVNEPAPAPEPAPVEEPAVEPVPVETVPDPVQTDPISVEEPVVEPAPTDTVIEPVAETGPVSDPTIDPVPEPEPVTEPAPQEPESPAESGASSIEEPPL